MVHLVPECLGMRVGGSTKVLGAYCLAPSLPLRKGNKEVFIENNNVIFMLIYNEIELTKNEFLATICVLVVCFNMDLAFAVRLI